MYNIDKLNLSKRKTAKWMLNDVYNLFWQVVFCIKILLVQLHYILSAQMWHFHVPGTMKIADIETDWKRISKFVFH